MKKRFLWGNFLRKVPPSPFKNIYRMGINVIVYLCASPFHSERRDKGFPFPFVRKALGGVGASFKKPPRSRPPKKDHFLQGGDADQSFFEIFHEAVAFFDENRIGHQC